jgi:hypothetical protein
MIVQLFPIDLKCGYGFKDDAFGRIRGSGHDSRAAYKARGEIVENVSVAVSFIQEENHLRST